MPYEMNIKGQPTQVSRQSILNALSSDSIDSALAKRSVWQSITDFFHISNHQKAIEVLFEIVHSKDSIAFSGNILNLAKLVCPEHKKKFEEDFRLKVTQRDGNSVVTVSLSELQASIEFEGSVTLFDGIFIAADKPGEYKLEKDYDRFNPIFESACKAVENSQEEFSFNNENFCANLKLDLPRHKEFFPEDNGGDSYIVTRKDYFEKAIRDFEPDLEKLSSGQKNVYDLFCGLSPKEQTLVYRLLEAGGTTESHQKQEVQEVLSAYEKLTNDAEKKSVAALIKFRVTLEYPGTEKEFQTALKALSCDDAAFYIVFASQQFSIELKSIVIPDPNVILSNSFTYGEIQAYCYLNPNAPHKTEGKWCFSLIDCAHGSQDLPTVTVTATVNYVASICEKTEDDISEADKALEKAKKDYDNVDTESPKRQSGESQQAFSINYDAKSKLAQKNLTAAISKADPKAITIKFDNAKLALELRNSDGTKVSVNKNLYLETREERREKFELSLANADEFSSRQFLMELG